MTLIYERRSSTMAKPVPALTSNYELLKWSVPDNMDHFLLYGIGTDQHQNSTYKWVVDDVELPINGTSRVGTLLNPYVFPIPIFVSGTISLYVTNDNTDPYPNIHGRVDDAFPYECVIYGRYE